MAGSLLGLAAFDLMTKRTVGRQHTTEYLTLYCLCSLARVALASPLAVSRPLFVVMAASSLCNAAAILLTTRALRHLPVSEVAPLANLQILVVVAGAMLWFGEPFTARLATGAVLIMGGTWTLAHARLDGRPVPIRQHRHWVMAVVGFVLTGLTALADRLLLAPHVLGLQDEPVSPTVWLVWSHLFITAYFLLWMRIHYGGWSALAVGWRHLGPWVFSAAAAMTAAIFLYLRAVAQAPIGPVVVLLKLEALVITVVGGEMFHEHRLRHKAAAGAVMLAGVAVLVW